MQRNEDIKLRTQIVGICCVYQEKMKIVLLSLPHQPFYSFMIWNMNVIFKSILNLSFKLFSLTSKWEIQTPPLCHFTVWFLTCIWHCWNPSTVTHFLLLTSVTLVSLSSPLSPSSVSVVLIGFASCSKLDSLIS